MHEHSDGSGGQQRCSTDPDAEAELSGGREAGARGGRLGRRRVDAGGELSAVDQCSGGIPAGRGGRV